MKKLQKRFNSQRMIALILTIAMLSMGLPFTAMAAEMPSAEETPVYTTAPQPSGETETTDNTGEDVMQAEETEPAEGTEASADPEATEEMENTEPAEEPAEEPAPAADAEPEEETDGE